MAQFEVGKLTRVVTMDQRCFIGVLSGYAEVSSGEDMLEEIYLTGCHASASLVIQLSNVKELDQSEVSFSFTPKE
ncbi:MAG: hypothetical protein KF760_20170 [Candidatus Eremiobacteraeota bacterium]|nr:hypothetical protein [Candidatus Eremiobacteraeota bacterium]MCW5868165.1 hypothetical protein [Candidatus Eremiobacteraeota bacterium]